MASKFPTSKYNSMILNDPQIVKPVLETSDWGSRPSEMSKAAKGEGHSNVGTIKHVESK